MKKKSKFGTIKGVDLLNALYHAFGAVLIPIGALFTAGQLPDKDNWFIFLGVFVSAFFTDIFKRGVTNSEGQVFTREKKNDTQ